MSAHSTCAAAGCNRRPRGRRAAYCSLHTRTPNVPDPGPARTLRLELSRARRRHEPFEEAWDGAVRLALGSLSASLSRDWLDTLAETRAAFEAAYYREPVAELEALGALRPE
jgi:hypothetical protein